MWSIGISWHKNIIKLANHPTLLQPNMSLSFFSSIPTPLRKRAELKYPFHARFVVTESNLASKRMIQDLMTALWSTIHCPRDLVAQFGISGELASKSCDYCYRWWSFTRQEWTGVDLSRFWIHEDSKNYTDGFLKEWWNRLWHIITEKLKRLFLIKPHVLGG